MRVVRVSGVLAYVNIVELDDLTGYLLATGSRPVRNAVLMRAEILGGLRRPRNRCLGPAVHGGFGGLRFSHGDMILVISDDVLAK
jgi:hypothetical protein